MTTTPEPPTIRIVAGDSDEWLIHWPNGTVEFFGFWKVLKLFWWLARNDRRTVYVGTDGKETLL